MRHWLEILHSICFEATKCSRVLTSWDLTSWVLTSLVLNLSYPLINYCKFFLSSLTCFLLSSEFILVLSTPIYWSLSHPLNIVNLNIGLPFHSPDLLHKNPNRESNKANKSGKVFFFFWYFVFHRWLPLCLSTSQHLVSQLLGVFWFSSFLFWVLFY